MFKAGWVMLISSVLFGLGWAIYNLWQAGDTDCAVALICIALFLGGMVTIVSSDDFGL